MKHFWEGLVVWFPDSPLDYWVVSRVERVPDGSGARMGRNDYGMAERITFQSLSNMACYKILESRERRPEYKPVGEAVVRWKLESATEEFEKWWKEQERKNAEQP